MYKNSLWKYLSPGVFLLQLGCPSSSTCIDNQTAPSPATKTSPAISEVASGYPDNVLLAGPRPKLLEEINDSQWVWELEFSSDGSRLAASGREGVYVWNPKTAAKISKLESKDFNADAELSADGNLLATGACGSPANLWDANTGEHIRLLGQTSYATDDIDFSPDGAQVAAALQDGTSRLWSAQSGKLLFSFDQRVKDEVVLGVEFSGDGSRLSTYSESAVLLWNISNGKKIKSLFTRPVVIYQASTSSDKSKIITLSRYIDVTLDDKWNAEVNLWDIKTGALQATIPMKHRTRRAELSPDGSLLAIVTVADRVEIIDTKTGDKIFGSVALRGSGYDDKFEAKTARFSPDGASLAVGYADGTVQLWDMNTQSVRATIEAHKPGYLRVDFSPDGTQLATAGLDGAKLWSVATGKLIYTLEPTAKTPTTENVPPTMAEVTKPTTTL